MSNIDTIKTSDTIKTMRVRIGGARARVAEVEVAVYEAARRAAIGKYAKIGLDGADAALEEVEFGDDIDASYGDHGIGEYEYWGCRGFDRQMGWEIGGSGEDVEIAFVVFDLSELEEMENMTASANVSSGGRSATVAIACEATHFSITRAVVEWSMLDTSGVPAKISLPYYEVTATYKWETGDDVDDGGDYSEPGDDDYDDYDY